MKEKFVIDENIVIFAEKLTNASGEFDALSHKVVFDIIMNCHTMVVDPILQKKYDGIFESLELDSKGVRGPAVTRMLTHIRYNRPKYYCIESPAPFKGEGQIPSDDVFIVRIAVETRATLVTQDERLIESIKSAGIHEKYGFKVCSPEEVFTLFFHEAI